MAKPVRTRRKNAFNMHREADKLSSFDEFPMLRPEVDPQLHVSRNSVDQPFHLICEKDTVVAQLNGASRLEFRDGPVRYYDLTMGDFAYVPGGYAHRLLTRSEGTVVRYKASIPGKETVVYICDNCDQEVGRHSWSSTEIPAQRGYQTACETFNADADHRRCPECGAEAASIDLTPFRWAAVAERLLEPEDEE